MDQKERKLREFIRREVHNLLSESGNDESKESEIRKKVRQAIYEVLSDSETGQQQLTEGVMGMADMPAVNPAQSFSKKGQENFSYDPNAVSQMAQRDRNQQKSQSPQNTLRSDSDLKRERGADQVDHGPDKTGFDSSQSQKVMFENKESGDTASLWIEGNQLVCEYESRDKGTQKTKLTEERTREILEQILNENFQM